MMIQRDLSVYENKKEDGNVLFLVLIAVALFAALNYAVSNTNRISDDPASAEQMRIDLSTLFQHITAVEVGYERLLVLGGCTKDQISFDHTALRDSPGTPYFDARFPTGDNSCHIFHPEGAGIVPIEWDDRFQVNPPSTHDSKMRYPHVGRQYNEEIIAGKDPRYVVGVGATDSGWPNSDGMMQLTWVSDALCQEVNRKAGITPEFPPDTDEGPTIGDDSTAFVGKRFGCRHSATDNMNSIYFIYYPQ